MAVVKISGLPAASLPLTGAELAPIVQGNITKKATVNSLGPTVNVKAYGATGDGVTDDTAAIQAACTAANGVFFPSGTYKVTTPVTLKSNNFIYGEGASSVILYTGTATSQGALYANSGSASTYVENLIVQNIKILGTVSTAGFNEFIHLISFNGVRNCLIDNCEIVGFRGDGIYIGSGDLGGQERHNIDVTISNCYIDGVNKDNRNGISVIDGQGINIDNNFITRCSRTDMPGAIDIEPDGNAYHIVRDISVRNNRIIDCGGNVAAIGVYLPYVAFTVWPNGFNFDNNYIEVPSSAASAPPAFFFQYGSPFTSPPNPVVTDSTADFSIRITNNVVRNPTATGRPFTMWNCNDVVVANNTFIGGGSALLGWPHTNIVDFALKNNEFFSINGPGDYGLQVYSVERLTMEGNIFKDCGASSGAARGSIVFTASQILENPLFSADTNWTKGTGWSIAAGSASKSAGVASSLAQAIPLAPGGTYKIVYNITVSAGSITPRFTGGTTVTGTARTASGVYTETLTAVTGNLSFEFLADATFSGSIADVFIYSGSSSYVKVDNNVFTSPNGSFTQQAIANSDHTFNQQTNTFLKNAVLAGTNSFPALQYSDNSGIGLGNFPDPASRIGISGVLPSSGTNTLSVLAQGTVPSTTTSNAIMFRSAPTTAAEAFTLSNLFHFSALQNALGAGSAVASQAGFIADGSLTGATSNYAFFGNIPAGSNRWNAYMGGTARNYFAGGVEVASGATGMTSGFNHIPAAAGAPTGAPSNPSGNVPMYYDSTNNKIYVYSGGTWRSTAALT